MRGGMVVAAQTARAGRIPVAERPGRLHPEARPRALLRAGRVGKIRILVLFFGNGLLMVVARIVVFFVAETVARTCLIGKIRRRDLVVMSCDQRSSLKKWRSLSSMAVALANQR